MAAHGDDDGAVAAIATTACRDGGDDGAAGMACNMDAYGKAHIVQKPRLAHKSQATRRKVGFSSGYLL